MYASLLFETDVAAGHNLSAGLSLNHDYADEHYRLTHDMTTPETADQYKETVAGAYAQYTLNLHDRLTAMAGLRTDHSSRYDTFVTPRMHLKYAPGDWGRFRLSAGKGYRSVRPLAENHYLVNSGRTLLIDAPEQEAAWNYGASASFNIPLLGKTLNLNGDYYYTDFERQSITDYDSDVGTIRITNLRGKSYSHTLQADASYPLLKELTVTAAWRWNKVRCTYGGILRERPLTSRYKGLFTASYKTPLGLWQIDATLQLNGSGRLPQPYATESGQAAWAERFPAYEQLNAQITRWFRHFSVYVGGENLTAFRQKRPIIGADDPWSERFEPTLVWGPVHGAMFYAGIRFDMEKITRLY